MGHAYVCYDCSIYMSYMHITIELAMLFKINTTRSMNGDTDNYGYVCLRVNIVYQCTWRPKS